MELKFLTFTTPLPTKLMDDIDELSKTIFGPTIDWTRKLKNKQHVLFNVALDDKKVVGFKIGYELKQETFYSWLGGVDPNYRAYGIASKLMKEQHRHVKDLGYEVIQTKTMNKWRGMLILNIKSGFDILETYTNKDGVHKIILEKNFLE